MKDECGDRKKFYFFVIKVFEFSLFYIDNRIGRFLTMKIIFLTVLLIFIFSINQCSARRREKRTLNSFLRYFGFKIVPLEDVEFVTEKIIESTRNPKALRIQTRAPKMQDNKNFTTTTPATTTLESNYEKLPQDLIDASALNLDALIDALTIMKAPNISDTNNFNQSSFIINVPSEDKKSEKFVEGSEDEEESQMEFMKPTKINEIDLMQMMQPPALTTNYSNKTEIMGEIADYDFQPPAVELPQLPLSYPQTTFSHPLPQLPPELSSPFINAFEIVRSKEISIPSNQEIIVGNSITVVDNPFQRQILPPQPSVPTFQPMPIPFDFGNRLY